MDRAELHLWMRSGTGGDANTVTASNVTSGWGVGTVTWNNQPGSGGAQVSASCGVTIGEYSWLVTALAQAWRAGPNNGLELRGPETGGDREPEQVALRRG